MTPVIHNQGVRGAIKVGAHIRLIYFRSIAKESKKDFLQDVIGGVDGAATASNVGSEPGSSLFIKDSEIGLIHPTPSIIREISSPFQWTRRLILVSRQASYSPHRRR